MRHYAMELIGTFFLTMAIIFTGAPLAIGLMLMSMVYLGAHISGAHYNPAVSLAVWMRGKLDTADLFIYGAMQTVGACLAVCLLKLVRNVPFTLEKPEGIQPSLAFAMEAILTVVLCIVVLNVISKRFKDNVLYGAAIGLALTAIASVGGLFNPAIALSSVLYQLTMNGAQVVLPRDVILIFIGGPLAGGALAVLLYQYLNPGEK